MNDPTEQTHLKTIAAAIFARHGIGFSTARRGGGWTNATWLAGGLVLRLSTRPENHTLLREARLAALFPPEVGYPPILETGITDGHEWILSQQIPGRSLGEAWPDLDWDARATALRQLWGRALAVHAVDPTAAAGIARDTTWFNSSDAAAASAALDRLTQQKRLSTTQASILSRAFERFWKALPAAPRILNHGDLTPDNALWDSGQVVSLLDFEYATLAPVELDLHSLIDMAFDPPGSEDTLADPDRAGLFCLRQVVAELARPILSRPGSPHLLLGYTILHALWLLEDWLAHPEGEGPLETWHPYRQLLSLADGDGGYLRDISEKLLWK